MNIPRKEFSMDLIGDKVYVFGGVDYFSPSAVLPSIEIYDSWEDSWSIIRDVLPEVQLESP
jgi:hypothetical protein